MMDVITAYNQAVRILERLERRATLTKHGFITLIWPDARHERIHERARARARRRYKKMVRTLFPPWPG